MRDNIGRKSCVQKKKRVRRVSKRLDAGCCLESGNSSKSKYKILFHFSLCRHRIATDALRPDGSKQIS